ncbi:MAG: hypothetical protein K0U54_09825, partial [Bacteroidetes bacterium]|nr:hypothetical protein [Bacteroidota bacterium]
AIQVIQYLAPSLDYELCERLAQDLTEENQVQPPELQLVLSSVLRHELGNIEQYEEFGHKSQIIHSFLKEVVEKTNLPTISRKVLGCFVDDETLRPLSKNELVLRCQEKESYVQDSLNELKQARILTVDADLCYRLTHRYLRQRIESFLGLVEDKTYQANRMLQQQLARHSVNPNAKIPFSELVSIKKYSTLNTSTTAIELIHKSQRAIFWRVSLSFILLFVATFFLNYITAPIIWVPYDQISNAHESTVSDAVFGKTSNNIISGAWDRTIKIWEIGNPTPLREVVQLPGAIFDLSYSPEKDLLVGSLTNQLLLLDFKNDEPEYVKSIGSQRVALSSNGKKIALGDARGKVSLFSANNLMKANILRESGPSINAIAFSRDNTHLGIASPEGIHVWDLKNDLMDWSFKGNYSNFAISNEGDFVVAGGEDRFLYLISVNTDTQPIKLPRHASRISAIGLNYSGKYVASGTWGGTIRIFSLENNKEIHSLSTNAKVIRTLEFSPNGSYLLVVSSDQSIKILQRERVIIFKKYLIDLKKLILEFWPNVLGGRNTASI